VRDQVPADMRGHSVVLVGYRNPEGTAGHTTFIFRNSYGDAWGFGGFGLMDESYLSKYFLSALYLRLQ
jgi:C1A family cysteine protease